MTTTGEQDTTEHSPTAAEVMEDLNDDALAEMIQSMREEGKRLLRTAGQAEFTLVGRMEKNDATVLDTDHWSGKLRPGPWTHTVADPITLRSRLIDVANVPSKQVHGAISTVPKVDQRVLNDIVKRGGQAAALIASHRTSVQARPSLDLTRKQEVQLEGE